ncbi:hypothetical protein HJG60_011831 [Phyllostomus discolor]|uniref:Uncharacterized protein n=1 Tax=Phyllostomus discolor TaxID=89673 RepID=A0A833ZKT8_9CHIR|nr:hypothetical protein HJG60_011831 [Phyllostomus discolor]
MGRAGTLCAETWVPLATPGGEEAHDRPLRAGPHLSQPAPLVSRNCASSWNTGRSLNTVPFTQVLFWVFTFLGVENSPRQLGFTPPGLEVVRRVLSVSSCSLPVLAAPSPPLRSPIYLPESQSCMPSPRRAFSPASSHLEGTWNCSPTMPGGIKGQATSSQPRWEDTNVWLQLDCDRSCSWGQSARRAQDTLDWNPGYSHTAQLCSELRPKPPAQLRWSGKAGPTVPGAPLNRDLPLRPGTSCKGQA